MTNEQPQILAETKFLRLVQEGHWTYAQRPNTTGAIAIVAVTAEGQLLLVEQHRIPVGGPVIELPAGLVGDQEEFAHEGLLEAAARELDEEAGYRADRWEILTKGISSGGLSDESVHLIMATGLERIGAGGGDATESIVTHTIPLADVPNWLQQQQSQGKQVDFKVYAGLFYLLWRGPTVYDGSSSS